MAENRINQYENDTPLIGDEFRDLAEQINPKSFFYFKIYQILRIESNTEIDHNKLKVRLIMNINTLESMARANQYTNDEYDETIKSYKQKLKDIIKKEQDQYKRKELQDQYTLKVSRKKFELLYGLITESNEIKGSIKL